MAIEAVTVPTRSRLWTDEDAKAAYDLLSAGQAAKFGEYETESKARTQGMALDRLISSRHGRRFGVTVWTDQDGKVIGALLPREPRQRQPKPSGKGNK
jgi:hypothetical protein